MDPGEPASQALFFRLFEGLERLGPGTEAVTRRALRLADRPGARRVLDLGCGAGAQSLTLLAALPEAEVTGIDRHAPFVAAARARAEAAGYGSRFRGLVADMGAPPDAPGTADLVWSEGAIYTLGVTAGLRAWAPLLAPRGRAVVSDAVFLTPEPPPAVRDFWAEYPGMTDVAGLRAAVAAAGFRVVAGFLLREPAWAAYFGPLAAREAALRAETGDHPVLAAIRAEIALRARHGACYDYAMLVVEPEA